MVRLALRDARQALEVVQAVASVDSSEPFPLETIELLARAVPSESVTYSEWDTTGPPRANVVVGTPTVSISPEVVEARRELCCSYPLSVVQRSSEQRALKISDFLSLRELRRSDYYDAVLKPLGIEHELRVWLDSPRGSSRVFAFSRGKREGDFGERDRTVLELLRPFLVGIRKRHEARTNGSAALTGREAEILRWVARGKTNREIASLLVVSPHTVRTHLEHAFEKLGVHTRAEAIASVFAHPN
jgi:DNA-binding CsgD family transcriptional regulator